MSKIALFMEQLKSDNIIEAVQTIKEELSERSRSLTESVNFQIAEKFGMKAIVEKKEDDEENLSDEEKEAKKAKEKEDEESGKE